MTNLNFNIEGKNPSEIAKYLGMTLAQVTLAILEGAKTYQDVCNYKNRS